VLNVPFVALLSVAAGIPDVVHLAHYVPHKQGANITFEPAWQKQAVLGHEQLLEMAVVPGASLGCTALCHLACCLVPCVTLSTVTS
jgi:hypothetical protein